MRKKIKFIVKYLLAVTFALFLTNVSTPITEPDSGNSIAVCSDMEDFLPKR